MSAPSPGTSPFGPLEPGWRWSALGKWPGLLFALEMVGVVAMADYITGYEIRLSILYMLPIALATWTGGVRSGALVSVAGGICWFLSFRSNNIYSNSLYYYWEGVLLMLTFFIFMLLLARLRSALGRADERFLRVLEGLYAGVYVAEEDSGKVLYSNRRLARMIDADPLSMRASQFERRFNRLDSDMAAQPAERHSHEEADDFVSDEVRDELSDRWYLIQSGPIPWERSQRVSLKVITDITEQKQVQIMRQHHQEMQHEASRLAALAEIASTLAHEINQPLMAIASYNDACLRLLAKRDYDADELASVLEKCRVQAVRAGQIIHRMRDFIRRRDPRPVRDDINDAVREALESVELELQDAEVTVELLPDKTLPPLLFDRTLIVQVLINLMRNAVDAMRPVASARRCLQVRTAEEGSGAIVVSVIDHGTGIPADAESLLYTPFFTTKAQGLGLGLCICRSVVEAHAGNLWHSAVPTGGTAFHFTLPCGEGMHA